MYELGMSADIKKEPVFDSFPGNETAAQAVPAPQAPPPSLATPTLKPPAQPPQRSLATPTQATPTQASPAQTAPVQVSPVMDEFSETAEPALQAPQQAQETAAPLPHMAAPAMTTPNTPRARLFRGMESEIAVPDVPEIQPAVPEPTHVNTAQDMAVTHEDMQAPEITSHAIDDVPYIQSLEGIDPIIAAEHSNRFSIKSALLLSGTIIAIGIVSATGFWLTKTGDNIQQVASDDTRRDWAGRPLATNENGDLVWPAETARQVRNVDLTQTGSISQKATRDDDFPPAPQPIGDNEAATPAPASQSATLYEVQSGDTLSAIGRRYRVSAQVIMDLNGIDDPRSLKPGMKLKITP